MPVLLHGLIVVAKGAFGHEVHVVDVRFAVVIEVMTRSGCERRNQIKIVELRHGFKAALGEHQVQHLGNISAVKVVMIADILLVASLYGLQKCDQLVVVELDGGGECERQVLHHPENSHHEGVLATQLLANIECIEIEAVDRAENVEVLRHASHEV